ncbi:MAG: fimbrial protein [Rhodanobacteraceae bacterium]
MQLCIFGCFPIGSNPVINFNTSAVTFKPPACTTPGVVVVLPTVYVSSFTGPGSTAGQTPFSVQFTCSIGTKSPQVVLSTSNLQPDTTSVIEPTTGSGYAQNVGVQILDGNGNAVTLGTSAYSAGTTANGAYNVSFYARYYQVGASVTAGQVHAVATYTLTYQ